MWGMVLYLWTVVSLLYFHAGISSTFYPWQYIMLQAWLDKETERHLKAPVFPLVCVSNLHAEGKAVLGNRRSWAPFKGWRRGLKSRWLPGSSPPKEPQRYLQEQQRWRRGRRVWVEAVTIAQPLEGAIAALQRSYLNGSALLRHERRREIPPSSQMFSSHRCSFSTCGNSKHRLVVVIISVAPLRPALNIADSRQKFSVRDWERCRTENLWAHISCTRHANMWLY